MLIALQRPYLYLLIIFNKSNSLILVDTWSNELAKQSYSPLNSSLLTLIKVVSAAVFNRISVALANKTTTTEKKTPEMSPAIRQTQHT